MGADKCAWHLMPAFHEANSGPQFVISVALLMIFNHSHNQRVKHKILPKIAPLLHLSRSAECLRLMAVIIYLTEPEIAEQVMACN